MFRVKICCNGCQMTIRKILIIIALSGVSLFVLKGIYCKSLIKTEIMVAGKPSQKGKPRLYYSFTGETRNIRTKYAEPDFSALQEGRTVFFINAEKITAMNLEINGNSEAFEIERITVEGKNSKSDIDLSKSYGIAGVSIEFSGGKLRVSPDKENYSLVLSDNMEVKGQVAVDVRVLIILAAVCVMSFWKIVTYLAAFKLMENHSRLDILFTAVFFVLLFIPSLKLNHDEISETENRTLAKYYSFMQSGSVFGDYGKKFDSWYNDRFFGREYLIRRFDKLKNKINIKNGKQKAFEGKDGWLFYQAENSIENYSNILIYSKEDLKSVGVYLDSIDKWCEKNNKKFYFMISPDKNKIYGEYYPDYIKKENSDDKSRANQLISYLAQNTAVKVIYPYSELIKMKSENTVYYKNDTHWTPLGAYYAYSLLMSEVKKTVSIKAYSAVKFNRIKNVRGDLSTMLIDSKPDNVTEYLVPEVDNTYSDSLAAKPESDADRTISSKNGAIKAVVFRDSFSNAFIPYFGNTFEKTYMFWRYEVNDKDLDFMKSNADIVILEVVERNLHKLSKLKFPSSKEVN